jgi:uncharacterized protein YbaP (TraB family)
MAPPRLVASVLLASVLLACALLVGCGAAPHHAATALHASAEPRPAPAPSTRDALAFSALPAASLAPTSLAATSPAPDAATEALPSDPRSPDAPRAWLYRVRRGPDAAPSYLLGTLHVGVSFTRAVPRPLDRALHEARVVVMEIDIHQAQAYLRRPQRTTTHEPPLDRVLPAETWSRLTRELSFVARPEELAHLPAGLVASYLRQVRMADVEAEEDGWPRFPGTASPTHLDRWIFDFASRWGVPFVALERPEETVRALADVPRESPVRVLADIVDRPEDARASARRLRSAYLSLDEARVLDALSEMSDAEREATFARRNRAWLPRLVAALEGGAAFVAVGLGHLLGEGSLVALLREAGFEVERVRGDGGLAPLGAPGEHVWEPARARPY